MPRLRKPWVAGLLSLLASPGLGQLYNGRAGKAALFLVGLPVVGLPLVWLATALPVQPINVVLPLVTALGLQVLSAVDAARDARNLRDLPRPWYSRWYFYGAIWLLNALVIVPAWTTVLGTSCVQAFKIPTGGMERTVLVGDRLLVSKSAYGIPIPYFGSTVYGGREPERGHVIAFLFPEDPRRVFLKRVIGLPGEKVEVRGKTVYIDDKPLEEPYAFFLDLPEDEKRPDWGPKRIPPGQVFVLGDNRDNSRDSRYWGFLPLDHVLGMARVVYFSWDAHKKQVRWERIGRTLR